MIMGATSLLRKYRITVAQTTRRLQASETLCRKGGTSRSDNAPLASGACEGAKLACGATLSATREFAWLARVLKRPFNLQNAACGQLRSYLARCALKLVSIFLLVFINLRDILKDKLVYLGARQFRRTQFELHTRHAFAVCNCESNQIYISATGSSCSVHFIDNIRIRSARRRTPSRRIIS